MTDSERISHLYANAERISYDSSSKFVFMSDCHRGDGSGADLLRENGNIYITALRHYYRNNYTYFELGDGDELWANKNFGRITLSNGHIFSILAKLYEEGRYYQIYGNHDIIKRNPRWVKYNLSKYTAKHTDQVMPLFPEIKIYESIVLCLNGCSAKDEIFLIHGHQVDFINSKLWKASRFLVRHLWRPLEILGIKDPTSPTNRPEHKSIIEQTLSDWSVNENIMIIAGHTHRTVFPKPDEPMYFNDGCCVYPRFITAIEIDNGAISLVEWSVEATETGTLTVVKNILKAPVKISEFFNTPSTCPLSTCGISKSVN